MASIKFMKVVGTWRDVADAAYREVPPAPEKKTRAKALAGALLAAACALAPSAGLTAWADEAASITVPVAEVKMVASSPVHVYPGRVVPVARVDVVPQVSGEILEVAFKNGQTVNAGDLLYRIDPVKYEAAVKNAEAKVAECTAALSYAELSYARHQKLVSTRAVSLDAVDNARSTRDSARASLEAAKAGLVSAREDLRRCRIVAPIVAKVGTTQFTEGNYVQKGQGTLVTLVQYRPIRVRFSISNRDFLEMFGGSTKRCRAEAVLSLQLADGSEFEEKGEVEYGENLADERTDTISFYALFPNATYSLRPGGTVTISLSAKDGVKRPAIPPTAILQDTQGPYVWVLDENDVAQRRSVARGELVDGWLFVEKGLKAGERVVADGAHRVRKGLKVKAFVPSSEARGVAK